MQQLRKARGHSLETVANAVGADPANLSRIEKGQQVPKRELARRLFEYYDRKIPLGAIYDPEFHCRYRNADLLARLQEIVEQYTAHDDTAPNDC